MVRSLLGGRFANTSFCIFNPDGTKRLTQSGRSPTNLAGRNADADRTQAIVIREMKRIASRFKPNNGLGTPGLQDFNTFRQALNVAAADQRLLVVLDTNSKSTEDSLRKAMSSKELVGRFHLDQVNAKSDKGWHNSIEGESTKPGIKVVQADKFGLKGNTVRHLSTTATASEITEALLNANTEFALKEQRKDYESHVRSGVRQGIFFENEIPYGEDRDGDGKIDRKSGGRGQRRGR